MNVIRGRIQCDDALRNEQCELRKISETTFCLGCRKDIPSRLAAEICEECRDNICESNRGIGKGLCQGFVGNKNKCCCVIKTGSWFCRKHQGCEMCLFEQLN